MIYMSHVCDMCMSMCACRKVIPILPFSIVVLGTFFSDMVFVFFPPGHLGDRGPFPNPLFF